MTEILYFDPDVDLSEPHVCGLGGRHYGVCPACQEIFESEEYENQVPLDSEEHF